KMPASASVVGVVSFVKVIGHTPPEQPAVEQTWPHLPQFASSVWRFTQTPRHSSSPTGHAKLAVTELGARWGGGEQSPVPGPAPPQPAKPWVASAVAMSTTGASLNVAVQVAPQSMPAGVEATDPPPPFATWTCAVAVPDSAADGVPPGVAMIC